MTNTCRSLSLREMWKLHLVLKDAQRDNVLEFIKNMSPSLLVESLKILYGKPPDDMASGFLNGLDKSGYFSFEELIKVLG